MTDETMVAEENTTTKPATGAFNSIAKRYEFGVAVADMYIAAQGICEISSSSACSIADLHGQDVTFKRGFNNRMSQSDFNVRIL
jgi:hypothetical protein